MADDLIQTLRRLYAMGEQTDNADADHESPESECVFVDERPKVYFATIKDAADALARKDAEIAELRAQVDLFKRETAALATDALNAESQLAALRERIEKAPVVQVEPAYMASMHGMGGIHCVTINVIGEDAIAIGGKRLALVALEE